MGLFPHTASTRDHTTTQLASSRSRVCRPSGRRFLRSALGTATDSSNQRQIVQGAFGRIVTMGRLDTLLALNSAHEASGWRHVDARDVVRALTKACGISPGFGLPREVRGSVLLRALASCKN